MVGNLFWLVDMSSGRIYVGRVRFRPVIRVGRIRVYGFGGEAEDKNKHG